MYLLSIEESHTKDIENSVELMHIECRKVVPKRKPFDSFKLYN